LRRQENVSKPGADRKETRKEAFNKKTENALAILDIPHSSAAALCRFHRRGERDRHFNRTPLSFAYRHIHEQGA